jgi:hypothetical protein
MMREGAGERTELVDGHNLVNGCNRLGRQHVRERSRNEVEKRTKGGKYGII